MRLGPCDSHGAILVSDYFFFHLLKLRQTKKIRWSQRTGPRNEVEPKRIEKARNNLRTFETLSRTDILLNCKRKKDYGFNSQRTTQNLKTVIKVAKQLISLSQQNILSFRCSKRLETTLKNRPGVCMITNSTISVLKALEWQVGEQIFEMALTPCPGTQNPDAPKTYDDQSAARRISLWTSLVTPLNGQLHRSEAHRLRMYQCCG